MTHCKGWWLILQQECFPIMHVSSDFAQSECSKGSQWPKVGQQGGLIPFNPLHCQILEEVSDETLPAWRRELAPTLDMWDCGRLVAHILQSREVSLTQRCRHTASAATTNKAWCCRPNTLTPRLDRRIGTRRQSTSSPRDLVPVHLEQIAKQSSQCPASGHTRTV